MALSRLGVDLDASSSSSDEDEPIVTKKRTQSPEGFPKRFLADAYLAADRAAKKLKAVEINQCVGCTALARSSGEEPASPRHRFRTNAP